MKNKLLIITICLAAITACTTSEKPNPDQAKKPNIVVIYLDDLGYGDVSAYGGVELQTPNIDRLAHEGLMFTDGHSSSSTCTPSRFALLTGVYPWRNSDAKILPGTAPLIIDTAQITIPKMLKAQGYYTGVVGKWHLGLGSGHVNWNKSVSPGPNEVGFDYSFIMAATQDRVPTVYLENGNVVGLDPHDTLFVDYTKNFVGEPTALDHPEMLTMIWHHGHNNSIVNGIPRIGFMKGGKGAIWSDIDMADTFLAKAKAYVKQHKNEPFFLYYALNEPHVPRTPNPRFIGKTGLGPRGDVIAEADWCVGDFMNTLDKEGLLNNTFVIFSSDNGPVLNDGYYDDAVEKLGDHKPWGPFRGGKYSLFEAGTRVPFITYWKGKITPGKSEALISQMDLLASLAKLTGTVVDDTDGKQLLNTLMGKEPTGRKSLVLEATSRTAYRQGNWLMIPPYNGPAIESQVNIELGNSSNFKLYNLNDDLGQQENLAKVNPKKLDEMVKGFESIRGKSYNEIQIMELK